MNDLFHESWYLEQNPDVAEAVNAGYMTATYHFNTYGQYEGRAPGPFFDPVFYLEQNPDVNAAVIDGHFTAYSHYVQYGMDEGRAPTAWSNTAEVEINPGDFWVAENTWVNDNLWFTDDFWFIDDALLGMVDWDNADELVASWDLDFLNDPFGNYDFLDIYNQLLNSYLDGSSPAFNYWVDDLSSQLENLYDFSDYYFYM